jgi:hypothetical protein
MKKHKYAELIKAWADGAIIESRSLWCVNSEWKTTTNPQWRDNLYEYRIKPEKKPNYYTKHIAYKARIYSEGDVHPPTQPNLKLCFDGETGELKSAEVIR